MIRIDGEVPTQKIITEFADRVDYGQALQVRGCVVLLRLGEPPTAAGDQTPNIFLPLQQDRRHSLVTSVRLEDQRVTRIEVPQARVRGECLFCRIQSPLMLFSPVELVRRTAAAVALPYERTNFLSTAVRGWIMFQECVWAEE